jgi:hypothetical protein
VPSKELPPDTELRRAPLFEAQVEIAIAAGDLERARSGCGELARVASRFGSKAMSAGAAVAHGRVRLAEGDTAEAERHFEQATRLWHEVGAPYEAAVARMGLADAHRARGHGPTADLEAQAARRVLERIGVLGPLERAAHVNVNVVEEPEKTREPEKLPEACAPDLDIFRREGDYWAVAFEGRTALVRDLKGMRYVARLLAEPQRELHVLDLVAMEAGVSTPGDTAVSQPDSASGLGDAGPLLDARAKEAYRRRLAEIEDDIEEARTLGDAGRAAQADVERDLLVRELSRAVGLDGQDRRAGSTSERARASVTRAIRQALVRVREHHPSLATHLGRTLRTGTFCAYEPDPRAPVAWKL